MKAARKLKAGPGGFTLVELLVAITIVLIFGGMAAETLREGAGMWRAGHRRSYAYDTGTVIFQQIQDDLSAAKSQFWGSEADAYDQRVKFWVDFDTLHADDNGNGIRQATESTAALRQWMRFVRAIPDYSVNPFIRAAGTDPAATGWYNLINPIAPNAPPPLMPLEGMCEVAYMLGLGADGSGSVTDPTTLYRAVLAPIGCTVDPTTGAALTAASAGMTFFNADGGPNDALSNSARIGAKALPIAQGVIYFEVRLWTQYTTSWDPDLAAYQSPVMPRMAFAKWFNNYTPSDSGAVFTWDSTCMDTVRPAFALDELQQGVAAGTDAIYDNVFPRSVMVVVTVEPPSELSVANPLRLRNNLPDNYTGPVALIGEAPPLNSQWPFVKIGDEWIGISGIDQANTLQIVARGVRGTTNFAHNAGDRVQVGYTFSRIFNDPAAREYWGQ